MKQTAGVILISLAILPTLVLAQASRRRAAAPAAAPAPTASDEIPLDALLLGTSGVVARGSGDMSCAEGNYSRELSANSTVCVGVSDDRRGDRIEARRDPNTHRLTDVVTVIPLSESGSASRLLGIHETRAWFGQKASVAQGSRFVSVTHMEGERLGSQTQCLSGKCITVSQAGCQKLKEKSRSRNFAELSRSISVCLAYTHDFADAIRETTPRSQRAPRTNANRSGSGNGLELQDGQDVAGMSQAVQFDDPALTANLTTLRNSNALHQDNRNAGGSNMGFQAFKPDDLYAQMQHLDLYAKGCALMDTYNASRPAAAAAASAEPPQGQAPGASPTGSPTQGAATRPAVPVAPPPGAPPAPAQRAPTR